MTTKTGVNSPIEVTRKPLVKLNFAHILAAFSILIVGFVAGIFVANWPVAETGASLVPVAKRVDLTSSRGPTLAGYTAAIEENQATRQRAIEADAARYSGLATLYAVENQRAIETEVAQYNGLATFYGVENQRAIEAEAARYSGLAMFYGAENQRAFEAEAARYSGLVALYTSVGEERASADFLAANPELQVAQRYTAIAGNEGIPGPSLLDADPARLLTHRSAEIRQMAETLLLAENPELSIVRRYAAQVEWNRVHFPGR